MDPLLPKLSSLDMPQLMILLCLLGLVHAFIHCAYAQSNYTTASIQEEATFEVQFNGISASGVIEWIETVAASTTSLSNTSSLYSMNPTAYQYTNGTLSSTAVGTALTNTRNWSMPYNTMPSSQTLLSTPSNSGLFTGVGMKSHISNVSIILWVMIIQISIAALI